MVKNPLRNGELLFLLCFRMQARTEAWSASKTSSTERLAVNVGLLAMFSRQYIFAVLQAPRSTLC